MKEKRMDCEKARNIDIVSTLANLGHFPVRKTEKEAWFLSPFRIETQASFKVSLKKNYWIDFGTFEGGSTIDLVMKMENCSVKEALERLSGNMGHFSFHRRPNPTKKEHRANPIQIIEIKEIEHRALENYLSSRKISTKTARKLCKEVHYRIGGADILWHRTTEQVWWLGTAEQLLERVHIAKGCFIDQERFQKIGDYGRYVRYAHPNGADAGYRKQP